MAEPKLLDQYRERLRVKHYSLRTEDTYLHCARRFIYFHGKRDPQEMNGQEVKAFLTHLATKERVAAATQNQALLTPFIPRLRRFAATLGTNGGEVEGLGTNGGEVEGFGTNGDGVEDRWWPPFTVRLERNAGL